MKFCCIYYLRLLSEYSALKLQKIALTILEENKMLIVFFRAVILYILIVISIRLMGKRRITALGACYNASAFKHRHPAYRGYDYTNVNGHSAYIHAGVP